MLRTSAANMMVLALTMAGAIACSGSSDSPAGAGNGGSAGEDPNGGAAATGGYDAASSGAGGRDGSGGSTAASGGAGGGGAPEDNAGAGGEDAGGAGTGGTGGASAGAGGAGAGAGGTGGASAGAGGAGGAGTGCTEMGRITYTLARAPAPTADQQSAYDKITSAMDEALSHYNCHTSVEKSLSVSYVPSVATADGNVNGSIRFGSFDSMNYITAMHEIGHTLGVGSREFAALVRDGIFTGPKATSQLRALTGNPEDVVHADSQHFWPYGLNYTSEVKSTVDLVNHCKIVAAIREDLGF